MWITRWIEINTEENTWKNQEKPPKKRNKNIHREKNKNRAFFLWIMWIIKDQEGFLQLLQYLLPP